MILIQSINHVNRVRMEVANMVYFGYKWYNLDIKKSIRDKILKLIKGNKYISINDLITSSKIPRTSLLRYLKEMEKDGDIIKHLGEVSLRKSSEESFISSRLKSHLDIKNKIIDFILDNVKFKNNDVIFIDAGSTNYLLAKRLSDLNITIVTNSPIITQLIDESYKPRVKFLPGNINKLTMAIASGETINALQNIKFDKAFLGFNSLNNKKVYTTNSEEAEVKNNVIKSTNDKKAFLIGGSHKINSDDSNYAFGNKDDLRVITERGWS